MQEAWLELQHVHDVRFVRGKTYLISACGQSWSIALLAMNFGLSMKKFFALAIALLPASAFAETVTYSVIFGSKNIGHLIADTQGDTTRIDYDYKNNGRGPTIAETIRSNADGLPMDWTITGTTTFGSKVNERFSQKGSRAEWLDSTGRGEATIRAPSLYISQSGSPWHERIVARALLKAPGMTQSALPSGMLHLAKGETLRVQGERGALRVTHYDLSGVNLTPDTLLFDENSELFAVIDPAFVVVRKGYEGEEERLRKLASTWSGRRFMEIEKQVAHRYGAPVRIRNVRLFDPLTMALTAPESVLVNGKNIAAVEPLDSPATRGEVVIDGSGGTLVAGFYDMHAHMQEAGALLNIAAGITSVRDMGNNNAVLDGLVARFDNGEISGPHVIRSGFIEGKSSFSANNGFVVGSEEEAVDAVRWYGARGYWQIKIYNSVDPAWVPAVVKEAHRLGMRVAGHVPAFSRTDAMINAGYDEMTHINQFMLGWVMNKGDDTRTLFRITAQKLFSSLDLQSDKARHTIDLMVAGHKAIDPTLGIHEQLTQNRDGQVPPGAVDYLDHMPVGYRRDAMKAWVDTSASGDDEAYRAAFDKMLATVKILHDRGIFIVFGTDTGGSFTYHRELELYQRAGFTPAEILRRATFDSAKYVGQDQTMGSIEKGKLADFFLIARDPTKDLKAIKTISMVVKDGVFYYPSEIYPMFGIKPFVTAPGVVTPAARATGGEIHRTLM